MQAGMLTSTRVDSDTLEVRGIGHHHRNLSMYLSLEDQQHLVMVCQIIRQLRRISRVIWRVCVENGIKFTILDVEHIIQVRNEYCFSNY